jgi:hypothetical protein
MFIRQQEGGFNMSYNKATDFALKDTLTSGDPDKVIRGAEIDAELEAIEDAVDDIENGVTTINGGTY